MRKQILSLCLLSSMVLSTSSVNANEEVKIKNNNDEKVDLCALDNHQQSVVNYDTENFEELNLSKIQSKEEIEARKKEEERLRKLEEEKQKQEEERQRKIAEEEKAETEKRVLYENSEKIILPETNATFDSNGLLNMRYSGRAQMVVNKLIAIPDHMNGEYYHIQYGIDKDIAELSTEEAFWVLHQIEGAGFGQTGDGYAGYDSSEGHHALITNQLNKRFSGSIHKLLTKWGTYPYGGY